MKERGIAEAMGSKLGKVAESYEPCQTRAIAGPATFQPYTLPDIELTPAFAMVPASMHGRLRVA